MAIKKQNLFWLAGLLEGEGCFTLSTPNKYGIRYPVIACGMTDQDVVERIGKLFDANVNHKKQRGRKDIYYLQIKGQRARHFMRMIYPYMGKRRQMAIQRALQEPEGPGRGNGRKNH